MCCAQPRTVLFVAAITQHMHHPTWDALRPARFNVSKAPFKCQQNTCTQSDTCFALTLPYQDQAWPPETHTHTAYTQPVSQYPPQYYYKSMHGGMGRRIFSRERALMVAPKYIAALACVSLQSARHKPVTIITLTDAATTASILWNPGNRMVSSRGAIWV